MRAALAGLLGRRARLRWVHLLLGGALLMPYYLLTNTVLSVFLPTTNVFMNPSVRWQFGALLLALPPAAVTALHPLARPLEGGAARALLVLPADGPAGGPARTWAARGRTALWYALHLLAGGLVSGMSLAAPPAALVLLALPVLGRPWRTHDVAWLHVFDGPGAALAPLAGAALLALIVVTSWAVGALLAACAPVLLGPTAAERLAASERRARELALRNRLARELHDSVGHALSAVTLQAGAARRLLESDPAFVRQALEAIEETTRAAVGELDTVLGLLREDGTAQHSPTPCLTDLDGLLERTRAAGGTVEATVPAGLGNVPPHVSREAYRIVQEGLANALRHAGPVPVRLLITTDDDHVEVTMANPLGPGSSRRRGGGRGLPGIAERARLLRGSASWGADGDGWRLAVRLPLRGDAR
ncbi:MULTISPECIES: histidine kinase [Streptomyces]|uniref:histidine kinase n=1 Tax=Streptomyces luteosporeus TaxID=173856 RepID=A0ABN3TY88_9ACTN